MPLQNYAMNRMFENANCKAISNHVNYIKKAIKQLIFNGHIHIPTRPKNVQNAAIIQLRCSENPHLVYIEGYLTLAIYDVVVSPKPNISL